MTQNLKRRGVALTAGAMLVIGGAVSGSMVASAVSADKSTDDSPSQEIPELLVEYQGQDVGHIRQDDLSRIPEHQIGDNQDPFYPGEIGFRVYDSADVLVGYATPRQGFIPLDQVDRYKADPSSFPSTGGTPAAEVPESELPHGPATSSAGN